MYLFLSCMCTYALANMFVHIFSLLFLVLINTTSFCLSPELRFNKADWFRIILLPVGDALPLILLFLYSPFRLGFEDWYIYMNIYCSETTSFCTILAPFFRTENKFFVNLLFFIHIICFQLEVTRMLHFSVAVLCEHTLLPLPDFIFVYSIYGV